MKTQELFDYLIQNKDLLKSDYLKLFEDNNLNTQKRVKTFYQDFIHFASYKINMRLIKLFINDEFTDFFLNSWLKHGISHFKNKNIDHRKFDFIKATDKYFKDEGQNIYSQANKQLTKHLKSLAYKNELLNDLGFEQQNEYWSFIDQKYDIYSLGLIEVTASNKTISYLDKFIKSLEKEKLPIDFNKTKKHKYLFDIGTALAKGKLDEDLNISKNTTKLSPKVLSLPKLAEKHELDYMHLKCTISDDHQANKSKNLKNNPEIINDVLEKLKTDLIEPVDWFLNYFKN